MRAVVQVGPGEVELNYMWLPTFIGVDPKVKLEIEQELQKKIVGQPLNSGTLDWAHDLVVDFLCDRYPIPGIREYIDAMKFVE